MTKIVVHDGHRLNIKTSRREVEQMLINMETAGRTCYQSEINKPRTVQTAGSFVRRIIRMGHFSIIEHSHITVKFINVSRAFTHSIVRNRLATFSQQSTVHAIEFDQALRVKAPIEVPLDTIQVDVGLGTPLSPRTMFDIMERFYQGLRKQGYAPVQARYFLPIASCNDIVMTCNFREWRHVFKMRLTAHEDWENRVVLLALFKRMHALAPEIFFDFSVDTENPGDFNILTYKCKYGS